VISRDGRQRTSQEKATTIHRNEKARSFVEKVLKEAWLVVDPFHVIQDVTRRVDEAPRPRLEQQISNWETQKTRFG
jgi:hypothetical protein